MDHLDRYQYLLLMGLCLLVTLPLEVAFGARVWRRPRRLLVALTPAFVVFVAWDLWASATGTWGFDPDHTVGLTLPGGMVVEELVFFTVIPICTLLTLESVRNVLTGRVPWLPWPRPAERPAERAESTEPTGTGERPGPGAPARPGEGG